MDRRNDSYFAIACCCRMLYTRAYLYGQVHSSALQCTDIGHFDLECCIAVCLGN
jgi:hypothetical protein